MIKHFLKLAVCCFTILSMAACSDEDSLEEIFSSHKWYVTNIYFTATNASALSDMSILYRKDSYYIEFSDNGTLRGKTASQNPEFTGTWKADGSSRSLSIKVSGNTSQNDGGASELMLKVLNNAASYSGDSNVLTIKTKNGGQYYMTLGSKEK